MDHFIYKDQKKMRFGYTTGSCAAAATKAAAKMLFTGEEMREVSLLTPKGVEVHLEVLEIHRDDKKITCAIEKDGGDDADNTTGILIFATVEKIPEGYQICGGEGVGRVTKPGLDQPVGEWAINSTPRKMILESLSSMAKEHDYTGGLKTTISVPEGERVAQKTFNPRLGILGGISILGTSGIVEPMSEKALVDTIRTEMSVYKAQGLDHLILTPGNYGTTFLTQELGLDLHHTVKCSNFLGDTIDMAYEFHIESILLIGHIGKLIKVASGIMNTHSKYADARMETLCACVIESTGNAELAAEILKCNTTDDAIALLYERQVENAVFHRMMCRIKEHLDHRAYHGLKIEAVVFSNVYGVLGRTDGADELIQYHKKQEEQER